MALTLLAANNAQTVLAAGISSSATSITVNTGTGALFPSPVSGTSYFKLTLVDAATGSLTEIVHVTARSGDVMTIQRGQEGTTARAWSANDLAANMMTAGSFDALLQKQSNLGDLENPATARANLGFDAMGIGLTGLVTLGSLDWQQFDFISGGIYLVSSNNVVNMPSGMSFSSGTGLYLRVVGNVTNGARNSVEVIPDTSSDSNYRIYEVLTVGSKGSRTFRVRQLFTSVDVIPTANIDAPGRLLGAPKVFGTSGSYTPGVNVKAIVAEIVGGGGGGGAASSSANYNAAGGGGGGGGYAKKYISISSTAAIAYTVGQGGNGATYPAVSGQNGGATTFGSGFTATGGSGGNTASSNASSSLVGMGGGGGTAYGGNINSTGSGGQNGVSSSPTIAGGTMGAGFGGASVVSGQGGPGGGGPGAVTTSGNQNVNGNRGNDGLIIIWEYA
ncbi:glycine-rich domain-containing protein [Atlantibacter hermannii]|uniref:glycine-rich domain-containing protein n=1 Tax=Atlantibacter hermannii TaxID=565 RepID=UPI003392D26A